MPPRTSFVIPCYLPLSADGHSPADQRVQVRSSHWGAPAYTQVPSKGFFMPDFTTGFQSRAPLQNKITPWVSPLDATANPCLKTALTSECSPTKSLFYLKGTKPYFSLRLWIRKKQMQVLCYYRYLPALYQQVMASFSLVLLVHPHLLMYRQFSIFKQALNINRYNPKEECSICLTPSRETQTESLQTRI